MSDTQELYQCPVCSKSYKRREHLQRHWSSHNSYRPYRCTQCSRAFQRHDVLKRHARTCEARAKGLMPPSGRRRACDLCVRQKKACSSTQPCRNCERLSVPCSYSFITTNPEGSRSGDTPQTNMSAGSESSESLTTPSVDGLNSVAGSACVGAGPGAAAFDDLSAVIFGTPLEPDMPYPSATSASYLDFLDLMSEGPVLDDGFVLDGHGTASDEPSHREPEGDGEGDGEGEGEGEGDYEGEGELATHPAQHRVYSFMFLDNFTKRTGLIDSFDCGTPALREETVSAFLQQEAEADALSRRMAAPNAVPLPVPVPVPVPVPIPLPRQMPTPSLSDGLAALPTESLMSPAGSIVHTPPIVHNPWLHEPLTIKIHQIVVRVRETVTTKPRNSAITFDWSPLLEQKCLGFFSPVNVRKFLALYWAIWHPNIDMIHRPTFDPATCKLTLLSAMAVIGASISPDPLDNDNARLWFNCVEEMVFNDDDLCSEPLYTLDTGVLIPATQKRKVQALQAAYTVCLYQNWEGTDASKQRIRRYRYSTVVSVARDIGIASARHHDCRKQTGYEFDWKAFVVKEELIRTFLWIFLLDHAFVIFNNLPPRLVIKEMKMHMARPDACFQAATAEECLEEIQNWSARSPFLPLLILSEAVELVCRGELGEDMHRSLADLGPLNLFAVVSAFHSLIFQHQNAFGGDGQMVAIRHALSNWKAIWEFYSGHLSSVPPHAMVARARLTPDNAWRRIGFQRHAPEFWLLASVIMGRLTSADHSWRRHESSSSWVTPPAHASPRDDRIFTKYDQTSMHQVNELISDFHKVQI
ncbi:hypothetical protein SODALDRAFT_329757 [Sodiomyces alkalinus F11]|uniref:Uncharacterized protein n=1 Tax=Sodiomyces alkalinus (strain CBS 110278 / VKM F-3762 / F11) TaxID=1314773 RepID=A0A3N2PJE7_SODAK|nr:hypothetical protein SODALDRAFT_329757 [Sodiomyces alkalinus F11]ROT34504.1 hypothetical protein SODALDRAFT_329757 [Sodiomyces alkalinus F11]